ncbi:MAG: amidohydrolase family protein [Bacteroidota bacterium]
MMRLILAFGASLLFALLGTAQTTYIYCGKLFDGQQLKLREASTIIIDKDRVREVKDGYLTAPEGVATIDLKDYTVMPGLIDMHVHLETETSKNRYVNKFKKNDADYAFESVRFAEITLLAGFTTVRDVGGSGVNISLRNAINRGVIRGPRVYTSGKSLAITGGHADPTNGWKQDIMGDPMAREGVVNGVAEARKAVRQRYKNGADLIKITATGGVLSEAKDGTGPHFTEEEIRVIVETARDLGMKVAAHAHGAEGMKRAVRAGVASIEHGTLMDEETMELMIRNGTYLVPTITAGWSVADSAKVPDYYPEVVRPKALEIGPKIQESFGRAYRKGVKIAFGTDAGVFQHGKNGLEFVYMAEMGMPALECLQAATLEAAKLLGVDDQLGTLEPGKLADVVAVKINPTENIRAMLDVGFVMKAGTVYKLDGKPVH